MFDFLKLVNNPLVGRLVGNPAITGILSKPASAVTKEDVSLVLETFGIKIPVTDGFVGKIHEFVAGNDTKLVSDLFNSTENIASLISFVAAPPSQADEQRFVDDAANFVALCNATQLEYFLDRSGVRARLFEYFLLQDNLE